MSLRLRVVTLFGVVLLVSVLMGAGLAGYEARRTLGEELASGLLGARLTVQSSFEDLARSDHPERDLRQLVSTFDGNRHVQAALLGPGGVALARSQALAAPAQAPIWFARLLGDPPPAIRLEPPGSLSPLGSIVVRPIASLDVDAVWREFSGIVVMLCLSAVAGLILVYALIGRALRPLQALSDAFIHVGAGDYGGRVPTAGPTELLRLQTGFNSMVEQLTHMSERNRHLTDQLLTLQDEERAEIARDLHDEFGPHLFAVNMDAEMIVQLCAGGSQETVVRQARSIQGAVGHMQRQVRDLLLRLRPTPVTELGFRAAVEDLVRFWTARRPEIAFDLDLDESAPLKESLKDVAYRVIQEGVNNAVRHGRPAWIRIQVGPSPPDTLAVAVLDDGSPLGGSPGPGGLGLIGMRERVAASGGRLTFGPRRDGGWMVAARLPLEAQEAGGEVFTVQV